MKRCKLVIPDAGPLNSLWVADRLDLLLRLDMPIVLVDAVFAETTSDPAYPMDRDLKAFIEAHSPPFQIARTDIWEMELERRARGGKPKRNIGEIAIQDFMSSEDGLKRMVASDEPVMVLFEDQAFRFIAKPSNLHLLSTVGLLRGLERVGLIPSADEVIRAMVHPTDPEKARAGRALADLPDGVDEAALIGSTWEP